MPVLLRRSGGKRARSCGDANVLIRAPGTACPPRVVCGRGRNPTLRLNTCSAGVEVAALRFRWRGPSRPSRATAGDPLAVVPFLREVITDASPGALVNATPLESFLEAQAAQPRFYALCAGTFAAVALLLAAFGLYKPAQLYGVATPARDRRPHGLGSRTPSRPHARIPAGRRARRRRRSLWDCSLPPPPNRIVESILFGVTPADPLTFTAVTAVLVAVGLVAGWLPARRATRIDPMNVLHEV